MGLYDNAWPHVYEEIKRFYPVWYRDVLEMDAVWRAQGIELDGVRATVEALIDNGYIMTADLRTIASLEAFLHINPNPEQTLQERRQVVATYVRGQDHIGAPEIRSIVEAFTSGAVDVGFSKGVISVKASRKASEYLNLDGCLKILHDRIPAHLFLEDIITLPEIHGSLPTLAALGPRMARAAPPVHRAQLPTAGIPAACGLGTRCSTATLPMAAYFSTLEGGKRRWAIAYT